MKELEYGDKITVGGKEYTVKEIDRQGLKFTVTLEEAVKRWWFDTDTKVAYQHEIPDNVNHIEVTADYAAYLQAKPEGEWELRKVEVGDTYCHLGSKLVSTAVCESNRNETDDRSYRWCKPRKVAGWREYPVVDKGGFYMVRGYNGSDMRLDKAANRVGFGGVQFEGWKNKSEWHINTRKFIDSSQRMIDVGYSDYAELQPAAPVRARFWEVTK